MFACLAFVPVPYLWACFCAGLSFSRSVKLANEKPYSQAEANAAAGMAPPKRD